MSELKDGCVKPAGGPILPVQKASIPVETTTSFQEKIKMIAKVGKEAIDFEATAFSREVGFQPVKLSDFKGKWIVLCFYPGDFTFV